MKEEKKIRKKIKIEDLLPRDPVRVDLDAILDYVQGKAVLVTGGGGSIGSEICRQLAGHGVGHLIIFDIYENNAYQIQKSLEWEFPRLHMTVLIGSVRDERRLQSMFSRYRPDIVFHAAAHKHVPLMEDSPNEAIKNNVIGTLKTARMASRYHVKKFILISTDKAVNPTNIMGASKRLCEMVIQMIGKHSTTEFAAVRFGNVLGSNGSVIPLFIDQIRAGNPITITDPNMTRFLMNLDEAVDLVMFAFEHANPGDLFIQKSDASTIGDLAKAVQQLFGDTGTNIIGTRHGEKLFETLMTREERLRSEDMGGYYRVAADNRDLNYDKFVVKGEVHTMADDSYTSHNTHRLDVEGTVRKILTTDYVQNALKEMEAEKA